MLIAVTKPDSIVSMLLELVGGENLEMILVESQKTGLRLEYRLKGRQSEPIHEVSDENKNSVGNWTKRHSCYTLTRNGMCFVHVLNSIERPSF